MCTRLASALASALLVPVAGCDNTFIAVNTDGLIVVAVSTTTSQGGSFQRVRAANAATASAKSIGSRIALVATGV